MVKNYGILQAIFNIDNEIELNRNFSEPNVIHNPILKSIDSKTSELRGNVLVYSYFNSSNLEHVPAINIVGTNIYNGLSSFSGTKIKYIKIKSKDALLAPNKFDYTEHLEKVDLDKESVYNSTDYVLNKSLKQLPKGSFENSTDLSYFLIEAVKLQPTDLDLSDANNVTKLDIYGTSTNRVDGLKSLKVSTEAPFTGASPQINISYTGLDKDALVELFNSLPIVSDSQVIDITGCAGTSSLTNDDKAIATNKGWTITGV